MKLSDAQIKTLFWIARLILGGAFLFSGFVKAVDPLGTGLKVSEYLSSFRLDALVDYSTVYGYMLAALEFMCGVSLLLSLAPKFFSFLTLGVMIVMTPLTLYLAIANPVSDCGCFGDAVKLTNWQTFGKNVFLILSAIFLYRYRSNFRPLFHKKIEWMISLLLLFYISLISLVGYLDLPILDFRPYRVGASIQELRTIPAGALPDQYQTLLVYQKEGVRKEFTLENYPAEDTTWTFVEQKNKLIKKGVSPQISDFYLYDIHGNDLTDSILNASQPQFLLLSSHLEEANDSKVKEINDLFDYCQESGCGFYCVTASAEDGRRDWSNMNGSEYPYLLADEAMLKTIIRSNPGLLLLDKGKIVAKWSNLRIPAEEHVVELMENPSLFETAWQIERRSIIWFIVIPFLGLVFLFATNHATVFARRTYIKRIQRKRNVTNPPLDQQ